MSKLRKKLQQARHEYQHQRYPGDLAKDLLGSGPITAPQPRGGSRWIGPMSLAAALAIAATAGLVLFNQANKPGTDIALTTQNNNVIVDSTTHPAQTTDNNTAVTNTNPNETKTNETKTEEQVEERWSLVPSGIASSQETSFSLVPSMSFDVTESETKEDGATQ